MSKPKYSQQTRLVHEATGHKLPGMGLKTVNPPTYRGSTLLYDDLAHVKAWNARRHDTGEIGYGIVGSDTTAALEKMIADLDGGAQGIATGSGLSAVALALTACLSAGDHLLIADNVYGPARFFADEFLKKFGVETTFFDPMDLSALEQEIQPHSKVLYFETPGSLTFEMPDCAALYALAKAHALTTIVDSTWPTSLYYPAIARGADISLAAGTKYYVGHSDAFFGIVIGNDRTGPLLRKQSTLMGNHMGPDDVYLALRGMRTLKVRLDLISKNALQVAKFLDQHPKVAEVRHPALPTCPGHAHWATQFDGASGLFGFFLTPDCDQAAAERMVESLDLFGLGYSWGGYESLAVMADLSVFRSAPNWQTPFEGYGPLIRLQIGLEDPQDLMADLSAALDRLA